MDKIVNYNNKEVLFHDLEDGGIDQMIKYGMFPLSDLEQKLYNQLIQEGDIVYDVGSYIGTHACFFSFIPNVQVFAFEASTRNFPRLVKNVEPFDNIHPYLVAFHEREYSCETLFRDCNTNVSKDVIIQPINYRLINNFIKEKEIPYPDIIKIDIEGMESILFPTLENIVKSSRPRIVFEAHCAAKELLTQNYPDNPAWKTVSEGGVNWNILKDWQYSLSEVDGAGDLVLIDSNRDYNEVMGLKTFVTKPL